MNTRYGLSHTLAISLASCMLASSLHAQDVRAAQGSLPSVLVHQITSVYDEPTDMAIASTYAVSRQAGTGAALLANTYTWNFNDGTWQGWTLLGKYRLGRIFLPRFNRYEGTFIRGGQAAFSTPIDQGTYGWAGPVMQRSVSLVEGVTYTLSFDHGYLTYLFPSTKGIQSLKIDGNIVIPQLGWGRNTLKFTATRTGPVTLTFWNNTDSGDNTGDFYLDNITLAEDFVPT